VLQQLRSTAVEANRAMATDIGIKPAAAVTCIKPSGTVSQLVDSASGIHPRHSEVSSVCSCVRACVCPAASSATKGMRQLVACCHRPPGALIASNCLYCNRRHAAKSQNAHPLQHHVAKLCTAYNNNPWLTTTPPARLFLPRSSTSAVCAAPSRTPSPASSPGRACRARTAP
jgi:hypothetical protein